MPDVPISLVPWFDAKDNPPKEDDERVLVGVIGRDGVDQVHAAELPYYRMRFGPCVWCDPSPPDGDDPLTVERLRALVDHAFRTTDGEDYTGVRATTARLRRALDQIGTTD